MRPRKKIAIVGGIALVLLIYATFWNYYDRTEYSCLECRATYTKRHFFGIPVTRVTNHAYTENYLQIHKSHEHHWCWSGSRQSYSLSSGTRGCGRRHPIWSLPIEVQSQYADLVSESELDIALHAIDSTDREKAHNVINQIFEVVIDAK